MSETGAKYPSNKLIWFVFAGLVIFVYFFGLTIPLVGPDEPRYAQVAREMFERGDWVTPTLGGHHWFEKPALLYWLQIASYHIFGTTEFAARLGSAIFGLGTILSLWILGRFAAAEKSFADSFLPKKDFANWLALIAASSLGVIVFARGASFDIILTFPMTAALASFYIFDSTPRSDSSARGRRAALSLIAFYFFIGVSLIAKGLIGIVFPFAIVSFYYLLSWRLPSKTFILSLFWGTVFAALVACLWYWPMYQRNGYEFIDEFFIQHHFQRYTSNKYFHPQPFYFFFWVLPLMTIPWLPFFLAAVWKLLRGLFQRTKTDGSIIRPSPLQIFALAWLAVPLVFFSFSGSKLPGYIVPAVPAAIILAAGYIWHYIQKGAKQAGIIWGLAAATFVIIVAVLLFAVPKFVDTDSVKNLMATANERGYTAEKVVMLHTISHNAEWYAAGRIIRAEDGKQKKLLGALELVKEIEMNSGKPLLVIVPLEYKKELVDCKPLSVDVLRDNGEVAIASVSLK